MYPDGRVLVCGLHELSDSIRGYVGFYDLIWFSNQGYLDTTAHHRQGNGIMQGGNFLFEDGHVSWYNESQIGLGSRIGPWLCFYNVQ